MLNASLIATRNDTTSFPGSFMGTRLRRRSLLMVEQRITLKCKLKCYVKPMKDPLRVSPSEGNQGTIHEVKKKFF